MIKTFNQAVKYLERYIPTPDKKHPGELGLERMQTLMDLLGNPQLKYPTIHVGGTSGKGSTSTIIASILAAKYKVGLHTSPHLIKINERIKILQNLKSQNSNVKTTVQISELNREITDIPNDKFVDLVNKVEPLIKKVEKSKYGKPSYFEIIAAVAFLYFYQQEVDFAVIEVGMGGRYDATNVINPLVAVITNVGLDHTEILGDTVEKIARDKAGIIKPRGEVVTGVRQPSVIRIIQSRSTNHKSRLSLLGKDFSYKVKKIDDEGSVFDYEGDKVFKDLRLRLLGAYQVENASFALRAIELIQGGRTPPGGVRPLKEKDIRKGLLTSFIPGRLEIVRRKPIVILDGAHNPDKVKALVVSIKKIFPEKRITSIIAIKNDKNAKEMLRSLLSISSKVIFAKFQLTGDVGIISSYNPEKLLETTHDINRQHRYASRHTKMVREMKVVPNVKQALKEAIRSAKAGDLILVTGSLYLVGELKKL